MKHTTHLARCATAAIAAALALGSTPLLAQDAGPADTTAVPEVAPPVAAPPVTVTPTVAPVPAPAAPAVVSHPVVQQVQYPVVAAPADEPSAAPAAPRKAVAAPVTKTVTKTTTQTATRTAPVAAASPAANDVAAPSDAANVLPPAPVVAAPLTGEQVQSATETHSNQSLNLIVLGALLVLVLAILAVIYRAFARRDRTARAAAPVVTPRQTSMPRPAPVAVPVAPSAPVAPAAPPEIAAVTATPVRADRPAEPTYAEPTPIRRQNVSFGSAGRSATPGGLPSAGASVDLPARVPEDYEERSALLKRMIEAKPDKANPFRNRKSRTKRARLILQSLGRKFEHNDPWIDLSQYPNNWPELARRYSQAA